MSSFSHPLRSAFLRATASQPAECRISDDDDHVAHLPAARLHADSLNQRFARMIRSQQQDLTSHDCKKAAAFEPRIRLQAPVETPSLTLQLHAISQFQRHCTGCHRNWPNGSLCIARTHHGSFTAAAPRPASLQAQHRVQGLGFRHAPRWSTWGPLLLKPTSLVLICRPVPRRVRDPQRLCYV